MKENYFGYNDYDRWMAGCNKYRPASRRDAYVVG
jgi:hypothetical protein